MRSSPFRAPERCSCSRLSPLRSSYPCRSLGSRSRPGSCRSSSRSRDRARAAPTRRASRHDVWLVELTDASRRRSASRGEGRRAQVHGALRVQDASSTACRFGSPPIERRKARRLAERPSGLPGRTTYDTRCRAGTADPDLATAITDDGRRHRAGPVGLHRRGRQGRRSWTPASTSTIRTSAATGTPRRRTRSRTRASARRLGLRRRRLQRRSARARRTTRCRNPDPIAGRLQRARHARRRHRRRRQGVRSRTGPRRRAEVRFGAYRVFGCAGLGRPTT